MVGFIVMAGLTAFALISRAEAIAQRDIARQKTMTAERTVEFVQSLFEVSDPSETRGSKLTAQEVLDKGAIRIRQTLSNEPNVKAQLMTTLSQVYLGLGSYRTGEAIIAESIKLKVDDPSVRARQMMALASSAYRQGDYSRAVKFYRTALPLADQDPLGGSELKSAILAGIGDASSRAGNTVGVHSGMLLALRLDSARYGPNSIQVARDLEALGVFEQTNKNYSKARAFYERAVRIRLAMQGVSHPLVSEDLNELGTIAYLQGDAAAAQRFWGRALETDISVLGPDHPDVAFTMANLARVMLEQRKYNGARDLMQRAIRVTLANRMETNDSLAFLYANLGLASRGLGKRQESTQAFENALRVAELTKHRNLGPILTELADLSCSAGQMEKGLSLTDRAERVTQVDYPGDPWRMAWVINTRGKCLVQAGSLARGVALISQSMPAIRERWATSTLYRELAEQRLATGRRLARLN
jgi:tetratricopeptide (TPR) repeat protein